MKPDPQDDLPADGNGNQPETPDSSEPVPIVHASAPSPAEPEAASTVSRGTKREDEVGPDLIRRNLETRIASLEDENRTLRQTITAPKPEAVTEEKKSWLEGGSFLD